MKSCRERDEKGRAGETDPSVSGNGKKPQQCSDAGKVAWWRQSWGMTEVTWSVDRLGCGPVWGLATC